MEAAFHMMPWCCKKDVLRTSLVCRACLTMTMVSYIARVSLSLRIHSISLSVYCPVWSSMSSRDFILSSFILMSYFALKCWRIVVSDCERYL